MSLILPKIIGHRGSHEGVYENSPAAFIAAAMYAQGLETDAVVSLEGKVFFVHDTDLANDVIIYELERHLQPDSAAWLADRRMDQMTNAEIASLRLHNGQPIPDFTTLSEAMRLQPGFISNIELKQRNTAVPAIQEIERLRASGPFKREQFILSSFSHPELLVARETGTDLDLCVLFEWSKTRLTPMYPYRGETESFYIPLSKGNLAGGLVKAISPASFSLHTNDLTIENLDMIKNYYPDAKILFWSYLSEPVPSLNEPLLDACRKLAAAGRLETLLGIITNYPVAMRKALSKTIGLE